MFEGLGRDGGAAGREVAREMMMLTCKFKFYHVDADIGGMVSLLSLSIEYLFCKFFIRHWYILPTPVDVGFANYAGW